MSATMNNEKTPNLLSVNTNTPIYPTLPPPYTPQAPSVPQAPSAPSFPQAPSAPPLETKSTEEPKPTDKLNSDACIEPIDFNPKPMRMTCPSCKAEILTRTERYPTLRTHACACCLLWIVWWPCICLPYCLPGCNNVDHFCPNCDSYIGGYKC